MYVQLRTGLTNPWEQLQRATQSINQSARQGIRPGDRTEEDARRQDRLTLSPMNQFQSRLESLMSQKQDIIEQKNQLIADTLDAGGDIRQIQSMVSLYDEQISNIDSQISQTMKDMMEDPQDKEEEQEGKKPETKEELQQKQMNDLGSASMDLERTGQIYSAYIHKQGAANVLEQEIKLDGGRGGAATPGKSERLQELRQDMDELYTETMEGYADLNVSLKESAEEAAHRHELESEEDTKDERSQQGSSVPDVGVD